MGRVEWNGAKRLAVSPPHISNQEIYHLTGGRVLLGQHGQRPGNEIAVAREKGEISRAPEERE